MGFIEVAQMLMAHLQFLALLNQLTIPWPATWRSILSWVEIFNLDFNDLLVQHDFPRFDYRAVFLVVAIVVPIALVAAVLIIFNPFYVVLWYASLVVGLIILFVGILGYYLPAATGIASERNVAMSYIILGGAIAGVCVLLAIIVSALRKNEVTHAASPTECNVFRSMKHLLGGIGALICGGILYGIIDISVPGLNSSDMSTQGAIIRVLAGVLLGVGAAGIVYFFVNITECGRRATHRVTMFMKKHMLKILLVAMSASYIPILSYSINIFMCVEFTCPAGTKFNPFVVRPVGNLSTSSEIFCDRCLFSPGCGVAPSVLCPRFADRRLVKYPDISCSAESHPYFIVAAALSAIVYCIGVPLLFHRTVAVCTNQIERETQIVALPNETFTPDELWRMKVYASQAAPSSLYRPYRLIARFYSLVHLLHKAFVVGMLIIISPFRSDAAILLTLVIHSGSTIIMFRFKPYLSPMEGALATSLAVASVVNSLYAVFVWSQEAKVPDYTTGIFIALNGVIPVVALLIVEICVNRAANAAQKERQKKLNEWQKVTRQVAKEGEKERKLQLRSVTPNPLMELHPVDTDPHSTDPFALTQVTTIPQNQSLVDPSFGQPGPNPLDESPVADESPDAVHRDLLAAEETNHHVDAKINSDVASLMTRYFMIMGVALFLALGFTVLGSLRTPLDEFINASFGETATAKALGGHPDWASFNSSCCCMADSKPIGQKFNRTERWVCTEPRSNRTQIGKTITRARDYDGLKDSGLNIRPMCGMAFATGCAMVPGSAEVKCSPRPAGTTDTALRVMW